MEKEMIETITTEVIAKEPHKLGIVLADLEALAVLAKSGVLKGMSEQILAERQAAWEIARSCTDDQRISIKDWYDFRRKGV